MKNNKSRIPEIIMVISIILTVVVLLSIFIPRVFGGQYTPENAGREVSIRYEEVNVREGHSISSKIITTLEKGDTVMLTGNSFESFGGDGTVDSWVQIQLSNGTLGWVVTRSIQW